MMNTKKCRVCGEIKPIDQFYKHPSTSDKRDTRCKCCTNKSWCGPSNGKYIYRYRPYSSMTVEQRIRKRKSLRAWELKNNHKKRAHWAIKDAISRGKLERKPCEVCGSEHSEAHHRDYSRPLDVAWLCHKHHMEEHARQRKKLIESPNP